MCYHLPMDTKKCSKCLFIKDINEFSTNKRGLAGKDSMCKTCKKQYNKEYHIKRYYQDTEYRENRIKQSVDWANRNKDKRAKIAKRRNQKAKQSNPEKIRARALVNQRVRFKRIPKASELTCVNCGDQAKEYHHHLGYDWENRYNVIPVCKQCHKILD